MIDKIQTVLEAYDEVAAAYPVRSGTEQDLADAVLALRLAVQAEPDNVVIVRYKGFEHYYLIDESTLHIDDEFEVGVPLVVRMKGIHHALRHILQVPEAASILDIALFRMRRIKALEAEREQLVTQLTGVTRG